MAADLAKFFKRQASDVAARIEQLQTLESDLVYHARSWDAALLDVLRPHFLRTAIAGAELEKSFLPKSVKLLDRIAGAIRRGVDKVLQLPVWGKIQDTTKAIVDRALSAAKEAGQSIADAAKAVKAALGGKAAESRAADAARTETTMALGMGQEVFRQDYAEKIGKILTKEWSAIIDDHTRPTHEEADGQTVKGDEQFVVGGELADYPGDPGLSSEERCGCRCSSVTTYG